MNRETGKDRWRRIPKGYFKQRDRLQSVKLQLSAVAGVLAIAWWAWGVDWNGSSASSIDVNGLRANHGELARVHSAWANQCNACHVPFEPIDGRPLFSTASSVENRSSDKLCMTCHAGPAHHPNRIAAEVKGCAQCHRDHQGADFSLVRMKDGECTSCHANLNAHIAGVDSTPSTPRFANVVKFAADPSNHPAFHPEAASFDGDKPPVDRSKLKFSHARHMMPGIVKNLGDLPYKVEDIPLVSERSRYARTADPQGAVQLDCASCHVLDSTEVKGSPNPAVAAVALPVRSPGRYYLPATFESSCRACHTLTVVGGARPLEVPHGVQPDQVADFLGKAYAVQVLSADPKVLDSYVPAARIPGKSPVEATVRKKRDEAVTSALKSLFQLEIPVAAQAAISNSNNCVECHYYGPLNDQGIPSMVQPTRVPEIWFTHAAFDHTAHRGVSCRDCHSKAYALEADGKTLIKDASWVATDYLNPGIDNCVQCHAPARTTGGGWLGMGSPARPGGGASFDCTECHRYHNGDKVLQGYGATAQGATVLRSVTEFLEARGGNPAQAEVSKPANP